MRRQHELARALQRDKVLCQLADLARIPPISEQPRAWFFSVILNTVFDAWDNDDRRIVEIEARSDEPLSRAIDALRAARQATADLNKEQREALWWPIAEIEQGIDRFLEWVTGKAKRTHGRTQRRGRPLGTVKRSTFETFIRDLLQASRYAGRELTFEKNIGKGTLIDAINLLEPYLPTGFIPRPLPSTLQRIKTALRRTRKGSPYSRTNN
jgi:hypothetical protein